MEPVWNGRLTCDYEHTRPGSTALELDLYTTSLTRWPTILMNESTHYGTLRRPGIVDIPERDHRSLTGQWHTLLADPAYADAMVHAALARQGRTGTALSHAEERLDAADPIGAQAQLANATRLLLEVMSAHIVNWLLPEDSWEATLSRALGSDKKGRACLLALNTPSEDGHLLVAHVAVLHGAAEIRSGGSLDTAATALSARAGTLFGPGSPAATAMPLEDADRAAALLASTAARDDTQGQLADIRTARHRATELRRSWALAALLAAAGDSTAVATVRAMTTVCRWAADSEERRKELRHRYLAAARRWCELSDIDTTTVTTADLIRSGANR